MAIYINIKEYRQRKQWTQTELANAVGVSLGQVQKWEGQRVSKSIPFDTLERLCLALECKPGDLLIMK